MSQVVLISGCSSGIGRDLAQRLAQSGYTVVATARNVATLDDMPAALKLPLDVTQQASVDQAVEHTIRHWGRIDVLVNNAGYALRGAVEEIPTEDVQKLFDVNVYGALRMIRAVVPHMRRQKSGRIINISSISGKLVIPTNGPYSATKFALEAFSDALRWELAPFGIRVVLIEPGSIKTHFAETARAHAQAIVSNPASPYRTLYQQSEHVEAKMRHGEPGPEAVSRVVQQAIEAARPKACYLVAVPFSGRLVLHLRDAVWDVVLRRMYKITPPATTRRAGALISCGDTKEDDMANTATGTTPTRAQVWRRRMGRLGLPGIVTLGAGMAYATIIEPWFHNWGATPAEIRRSLPGDELAPDAAYVTTRAVTINAAPSAIWPWLVQIGQGRGGLYSYDWLENLVGCDMHSADRIHPEWQQPRVGDPVRMVPECYLGFIDTGPTTAHIASIDPHRAFVVKGFFAFILEPIDAHTTRLILRGRAPSALAAQEPFNFVMMRRMMLGVKERAEGAMRAPVLDIAEVVSWMVAFGVSAVAGSGVLVRKEWQSSLAVMAAAIANLLALLFARPPLWASGLLDSALVAALAGTFLRPARPAPDSADRTLSAESLSFCFPSPRQPVRTTLSTPEPTERSSASLSAACE